MGERGLRGVDEDEHDVTIARSSDGWFVIYCYSCKRRLARRETYDEAYKVLARHERGEDSGEK